MIMGYGIGLVSRRGSVLVFSIQEAGGFRLVVGQHQASSPFIGYVVYFRVMRVDLWWFTEAVDR